jgi:hypothetical protein
MISRSRSATRVNQGGEPWVLHQPLAQLGIDKPHFTLFVLLAVADRLIGSIATDFEQFMPRGWSFAARAIVGEVWRR